MTNDFRENGIKLNKALYPPGVRWPRHKFPGMKYPANPPKKNRKQKKRRKRGISFLEKQILYFIRKFQEKHLYSPMGPDIAYVMGFSKSTANYHIEKLHRKGLIERSPGTNRDPHRVILFPRSTKFDWSDFSQFPIDVFLESNKIVDRMQEEGKPIPPATTYELEKARNKKD